MAIRESSSGREANPHPRGQANAGSGPHTRGSRRRPGRHAFSAPGESSKAPWRRRPPCGGLKSLEPRLGAHELPRGRWAQQGGKKPRPASGDLQAAGGFVAREMKPPRRRPHAGAGRDAWRRGSSLSSLVVRPPALRRCGPGGGLAAPPAGPEPSSRRCLALRSMVSCRRQGAPAGGARLCAPRRRHIHASRSPREPVPIPQMSKSRFKDRACATQGQEVTPSMGPPSSVLSSTGDPFLCHRGLRWDRRLIGLLCTLRALYPGLLGA